MFFFSLAKNWATLGPYAMVCVAFAPRFGTFLLARSEKSLLLGGVRGLIVMMMHDRVAFISFVDVAR